MIFQRKMHGVSMILHDYPIHLANSPEIAQILIHNKADFKFPGNVL